jgi:hypothetical protein
MKIKSLVASIAMVAVVSLPGVVYAAPTTSVHAPVHAFFGKPHKVNFTLRNDSQQPLSVKAGDQDITIQPGKTAAVKLVAGDKVVAQTATTNHPVGDVIVVASDELNDSTLHII